MYASQLYSVFDTLPDRAIGRPKNKQYLLPGGVESFSGVSGLGWLGGAFGLGVGGRAEGLRTLGLRTLALEFRVGCRVEVLGVDF